VTLSIPIPKDDLVFPSLHDRIPGTEYSEREMREMLGIHFEGLPNTDLLFLPENWDEEIKPWRRDETGPSPENIRELS
jgi:membrane-bound hydrogenase subunit beta